MLGVLVKTFASVKMKLRTYQLRTETGQRTKSKILELFPPASGRTRKAVIQNQVTEGSAGADLGQGPAAPFPPPPLIFRPNWGPKGRKMFALRHSLIRSFHFIQVYVFKPLIHNSPHSYAFHPFWFTPIFSQRGIFFLFLMMLLISSLRPYSNNILLYNVYSFDTMEFSIKK